MEDSNSPTPNTSVPKGTLRFELLSWWLLLLETCSLSLSLSFSVRLSRSVMMDRISGAFGQFRTLVGMDGNELEQDEELSFMDDLNRSCTLTRKQRLYGFATCLLLGFVFSILSVVVLLHPTKFAVTFTLGNLLYLGSTCFLIGPMQQLKMMLDPVRFVATIVYVGSMVLALVAALYLRFLALAFVAVVIELLALIWYSLSYIPFARAAATRGLNSLLQMEI